MLAGVTTRKQGSNCCGPVPAIRLRDSDCSVLLTVGGEAARPSEVCAAEDSAHWVVGDRVCACLPVNFELTA